MASDYLQMSMDELECLPAKEIKSIPLATKRLIVNRFDSMPDVRPASVRRLGQILLGLRKPRKKAYASKAERVSAAKERAKKRSESARDRLAKELGLTPKKKVKMTKDERKANRQSKREAKRNVLRAMAEREPDLLRSYGIDPKTLRFKFNRKTGLLE